MPSADAAPLGRKHDADEQSSGLLAAIVRSSQDAIIGKTVQGVITSWNPAAERLYGYAPPEIIGCSAAVLFPPAQRAREFEILQEVLRGEPVEQYETERIRKDGTVITVSLTVSPILDAAGHIVGVSSVSRDMTEQLQVRRQQEQWEQQAHRSQRLESLGQLAGGVAHDFNNLLAVIVNYAALIEEDIAAAAERDGEKRWAQTRRDVQQTAAAAQRGVRLTQQLLAFGRREVIRPRALNLNTVVGEVQELLCRTLGEHIALATELDQQLWPVLADPGQLEQVLMNLAVNARHAMHGTGTLTIDTKNLHVNADQAAARPGLHAGRYIRLRVSDTGMGMPPDVLDRAFEPFFTTKAEGEGTGLGLATIYGVITQAGGTAYLLSELNVGTSFVALLPATDADAGAEPAPRPRRTASVQPGGETILLVEDEPALREVTRRLLARNGYHILEAQDPEDALRIAEHHPEPIHLLLTDVVMPRMLGKQVAEQAKRLSPQTKVLYMSGYAKPVLASQGSLEPGVTLLEKPFSEADLLDKVTEVLISNP
ncbi:PAS domain S-box protein [Actinoplanes sp. NPDC051343]|uniref:PAS domain S-box protein n=1 Tax=Actinoplanes sp. NPDC051343 TaxID=3363906 RepID=UPI0037A66199